MSFPTRSCTTPPAARISAFDPTGPYNAALYRQAEHTRQVPKLVTHDRLVGGGDLQVITLKRSPGEQYMAEAVQAMMEDYARTLERAIEVRRQADGQLNVFVREIMQ